MSERIKQLACASLLPALFAGAGRLVFAQEGAHRLDADRIAAAAGTKATTKGGGVRI